jgi:hypothetical protein
VPNYLVESYAANRPGAVDTSCERARQAAALEDGVRHVRATFIPTDETVLHLFEATTVGALRRALDLASMKHERIVEAIEGSPCGQVAK